jgi:hypothetical protein
LPPPSAAIAGPASRARARSPLWVWIETNPEPLGLFAQSLDRDDQVALKVSRVVHAFRGELVAADSVRTRKLRSRRKRRPLPIDR